MSKFALFVFAFLVTLICVRAEEKSARLGLIFVHWSAHKTFFQTASDPSPPKSYPLTPNRVADCLPGELFDVRGLFEEWMGIKFSSTEFAWYNPQSKLLVIRATPENIICAEQMMDGTLYCPSRDIEFKGELFVRPASGGEVPASQRLRWEVSTACGQRMGISAGGGDALGYSCGMEAYTLPHADEINFAIDLKVSYGGHDYTVTSETEIPLDKPHSMLIGTTPAGEEIRLLITPSLLPPSPLPPSPLDDPANKKRLLECLEKSLRNL